MQKPLTIVFALGVLIAQIPHSILAQSGRTRQTPRPPTVQITERPASLPKQISPSKTPSQVYSEPKQLSIAAPAPIGWRELKGGEIHYYPVPIPDGHFCTVVVEQRGIDLVITLIAPDGKRLSEVDTPNGSWGPESLSFLSGISGEYRLEIRALEDAAETGRYDAKVTERRVGNRQDRVNDLATRLAAAESEVESDRILEAESELAGIDLGRAILVEGRRLLRETRMPRARVLLVFQRLLRLTENPAMRGAAGMAHRGIGNAYAEMLRFDLAEEHFLKTLAIFARFDGTTKQGQAWTSNDLAALYWRKGELNKAIEYYERSRNISEQLGDTEAVVRAQHWIAACYSNLRNFPRAYENLEDSLRLADTLANKSIKIGTLNQIAGTFGAQGRLAKQLETYQIAYRLAEDSKSIFATADLAYAIGLTHQNQGNLNAAYANYRRVILLSESTGYPYRSTQALLNIGSLYRTLGNDRKATEAYERGLRTLDAQIARKAGGFKRAHIAEKAWVMNFLAQIKQKQGDFASAFATYEKALMLLDSVTFESEQDPRLRFTGLESYLVRRIDTHRNIGNLLSSRRDYAEASNHFQKALFIAEKERFRPGIVQTLTEMAANATRHGDHSRALAFATRAEELIKKEGRLDYLANLKTTIGKVNRQLGNSVATGEAFNEAIKIAESLRSDVTTPVGRATYFEGLQAPYDEYIDFLMDQHSKEPAKGHDRTAFDISERRRARALLESLKEARADIRRGVDANLIQQETEIRNRLNNAARARDPFAEAAALDSPIEDMGPPPSPDTDIPSLTAELQRIETAIRAQSPRYSALTQPQPLKASEIETSILDDDTILLNYTLGEKRSFLWAIAKGSTMSYTLPPRAEIELSVKKAYAYLKDGTRAGDIKAVSDFESEAAKLSRTLLAPASAKFGTKRLVIVADGVLQYLPFSTLPDPRVVAPSRVPMLASNEITFAPSASVVGVLRQELGNRPAAAKSVAVFADPVFSETDERLVPGKVDQTASGNRDFEDTRISRGLLFPTFADPEDAGRTFSIPRLPFSRREADALETIAPTGTSLKAVDFEASRENVLNSELSKYRIIHFATHGILHSEHPELSGVVLSLVNEKGEPVNGFLRLNEIYNMNLNADLVVLSACQTALGKEIRGEGLIGLTRGFMYAGSPRVVASLWKVDDVATAELMKIFYQKMLKENMRPAAALRAAKVEMWKSKRWNAPFYWGAFELQGEWR